MFSFSSRFRPHSRERWSMVGVGVVVHHGRQETGRGADCQRTLGQVWTQLLLQVTGLNNLPCFNRGATFLVKIITSWINLQVPRLTSWFPFPKSLNPLYPYQSQICLPGLHLRPFLLRSSSLLVTCSYFNLSPVRGRDSYCSQCSHWQLLQLFMFPQRAFLIWGRFPTTCRWTGPTRQAKYQTPKKSIKHKHLSSFWGESTNHPEKPYLLQFRLIF